MTFLINHGNQREKNIMIVTCSKYLGRCLSSYLFRGELLLLAEPATEVEQRREDTHSAYAVRLQVKMDRLLSLVCTLLSLSKDYYHADMCGNCDLF